MTSMPASRNARAMIFAPRSCPSRPGFATTTLIGPAIGSSLRLPRKRPKPEAKDAAKRALAGGEEAWRGCRRHHRPRGAGNPSTALLVERPHARGGETALSPQRTHDHNLRRTRRGLVGEP